MQNISGSAANWNKSPLEKRSNDVVIAEEVIEERKEMDPKAMKLLLKKLHDASEDINLLYNEFPLKHLGDSSIMLKSVIRSIENNFSRN